MVDMSVKIGSVTLKNPIMPASGCFSTDLAQVIDLNRLGALVAKTVSREFRAGNPPPRVSEVEGGMINSIGLPTCSGRSPRSTRPSGGRRSRSRSSPTRSMK